MKTPVQRIVDQSSVVAAGLGVILSPVPLADELLLFPLLGTMALRIGRVHGLGWRELPWKAIAKNAAGGLAARATVNLGVSYIPFVAAAANAASAAALTGAFGAYADRTCRDPARAHAETLGELKVDVHDLVDRWRRLWPGDTRKRSPDRGDAMTTSHDDEGPTIHAPTPSVLCEPVGQEVRADIERSLRTRRFGRGKVLFAVEDRAKTAAARVWVVLKKRPYAGIGASAAFGFTVAAMTGVGELAVAVLCGYAAYEVLRRGQPVEQTLEEVVRDVAKMG